MSDEDEDDEAGEIAIEQLHQIMLEVKEYLDDTANTPKGQRLLGKVELVLDNWDDDALFGSSSEDDEDDDEDDEDDGDEDEEFVDHEEDEGSILDAPDDDD